MKNWVKFSLFGIIIFITTIILFVILAVIFYSSIFGKFKYEKSRIDLLETVSDKIKILNTVPYCAEFDYLNSPDMRCFQINKEKCSQSNDTLITISKKLEDLIKECINLQVTKEYELYPTPLENK